MKHYIVNDKIPNENDEFIHTVKMGDTRKVESMLKNMDKAQKVSIHTYNLVFLIAAKEGYCDIVKLLIDAAKESGLTELMLAGYGSYPAFSCAVENGRHEIAELLLNAAQEAGVKELMLSAYRYDVIKDNHSVFDLAVKEGRHDHIKLLVKVAKEAGLTKVLDFSCATDELRETAKTILVSQPEVSELGSTSMIQDLNQDI
jgi:hypothetical protein